MPYGYTFLLNSLNGRKAYSSPHLTPATAFRASDNGDKLEAALTSDTCFVGNNDFSFGGQTSLPETSFYPNHNLPTLQGDRTGNPFSLNDKLLVPNSVWKVVLILDKPRQGISDVNKHSLAFGLYLPNGLDYTEDKTDSWKDSFLFEGKGYGLFNVKNIEQETGYNLFSNLPEEIQNAIEGRNVGEIRNKINELDSQSASLQARGNEKYILSGITTISPHWTPDNTSIGHSGIPNQIVASADQTFFGVRSTETSISENSRFQGMKVSSTETSSDRVDIIEVASSQIGVEKVTQRNIGSSQTSIPNNTFIQPTFIQENASQVGSSQIDSDHFNSKQVSSPQVNISQNDSIKVDTIPMFRGAIPRTKQLNSSEITLPASIPLQQFVVGDFPDHNSTPQIINELNNSATNIWSDLLQTETQLDIDFQITELSKGQLAEATITDFDDAGVPNAGTILIDHDANGVGWFIDETPLNNSEFTAQDTESVRLKTTI